MIRIDAIPSGDAVFFDGSDIKAQLWEISENLHRAELTTLEYGEQVARWVELKNVENASEQLTEKVGQLDPVSGGGRGLTGGVRAAARELPLDGATEEAKRSDARRALKISGLSEEAKSA
jgi:hypothetical protein